MAERLFQHRQITANNILKLIDQQEIRVDSAGSVGAVVGGTDVDFRAVDKLHMVHLRLVRALTQQATADNWALADDWP